jgi:glycosyltransferase involved in cell wall biosynthesis
MTTISLCLMVRDEEALLPGCLASARGAVDQVVVVDTGSVDGTRQVARDAGALVLERPWDDDFSAPRNLAARHATGDWILVLDADERLASGAGPALRQALRQATFDVGMVRLHNAGTRADGEAEVLSGAKRRGPVLLLPRLVRHAPDLLWTGAIHENVGEWLLRRGGTKAVVPVDLLHYGYVFDEALARRKLARNVALLRRRIELEPEDLTPHGYLALELLEAGQAEEAWAVVEAAWARLDRQPPYRCFARVSVARAILSLRRADGDGAIQAAQVGERRNGGHPDFDYLRGVGLEIQAMRVGGATEAGQALLAEAEAAHRVALRRLRQEGPFEFLGAVSEARALVQLGVVRYLRRDAAGALRAYGEALQAEPASPAARVGAAEVLVDLGDPRKALELVEPALGAQADGWLVAACAAERLGSRDDARTFLAQARARLGAGFQHAHRSIRLQQLERALAEA